MKNVVPIILSLWIYFTNISIGQESNITTDNFEKLIPKVKEGYVYIGDGELIAVRSCYIVWVKVSFDLINFNKSDSTLRIKGSLYNEARYGAPPLTGGQIMIGKFEINPHDSTYAKFKLRESISLGDSSHFNATFQLNSQDYLCFASVENGQGWVKLYKVGKLLN
jgi:hypothetical protein